jgi:hypothetical protein
VRNVPKIWETWKSGNYVGDNRPATRVTVEPSYWLRSTNVTVGTWERGPARWFQREVREPSLEEEVPNVISVDISRALSAGDCGSCEITIVNTWPQNAHELPALEGQYGDLGHLSWDRGDAPDATGRWQHTPNAWADVLVPNALLRTYQGFGGHDKTVTAAVADGNVVLNGVWLVDTVNTGAEGTMTLSCRDMGKLLLDQQLYPPLVPTSLYPLLYERWRFEPFKIPTDTTGTKVTLYSDYGGYGAGPYSSTDAFYGEYNTKRTGHPPSDAFDWSPSYEAPGLGPGSYAHQRTYWLSEPRSGVGDQVWIEFNPRNAPCNIIYYHELDANNRVEVCIWENGDWVYPEPHGQGGFTADGVPFVTSFTPSARNVPGANEYPLPRTYQAHHIRLVITNLATHPEGGYRGGIRKAIGLFDPKGPPPPYTFCGSSIPFNTEGRTGYWQALSNGQIYAFGDARVYEPNDPGGTHHTWVVGMAAHPSGQGYWTIDLAGKVIAAGQCNWYGDADQPDAIDIASTPSGWGYWILCKSGIVVARGDATHYGNSIASGTFPPGVPQWARSIDSHPITSGYWVVWTNGVTTAHNVTDYGDANRIDYDSTEYVSAIRRTSNGAGYWITSTGGIVQTFGNAIHRGDAVMEDPGITNWAEQLIWDLFPSSLGDNGYQLQNTRGQLSVFGTMDGQQFGSVGLGGGQLRVPGNYTDYADIVRELLLWAGFYLHPTTELGTTRPAVYGNIETTGVYSDSALATDMFMRVPVVDAIKALCEIVGYDFWIDCEGGARFESPRWWVPGNYLIDGTPFNYMPEIDERVTMIQYAAARSAADARSELIIATQDPAPQAAGKPATAGIGVTRIVPNTANDLKGMIVPAMWTNEVFLDPSERKVMAELIEMRTWFARRTGSVSCAANPLIDVGDQIRIIERQTNEVYIHYVKSISFTHDLVEGSFTMDLTTHWLGGSYYPTDKRSYFFAADINPMATGLWQVNMYGEVFAKGDAEVYDSHQADGHVAWVVTLLSTPTGLGYYTFDLTGKILTYGDAVHRGEELRAERDFIDMALTPSGNGYWAVLRTGDVYAFGDAVHYGSPTITGNMPWGIPVRVESIESHPTLSGYWILLNDGTVHAFNLPHYGNANREGFLNEEILHELRSNSTGDGYFAVSTGGKVQVFGNAVNAGDAPPWTEDWPSGLVWTFLPQPDDSGYSMQRANGSIIEFGVPKFTHHDDHNTWLYWALVSADKYDTISSSADAIPVSIELKEFLAKTGSPSANNAVAIDFAATEPPVDIGPGAG